MISTLAGIATAAMLLMLVLRLDLGVLLEAVGVSVMFASTFALFFHLVVWLGRTGRRHRTH